MVRRFLAVSVALLVLAPSGLQAADPDIYYIVNGPGGGIRFLTEAGSTEVTPRLNDRGTRGHIAPPHDGCKETHYHGTLRGNADPRPTGVKPPEGCGWGAVQKRSESTPLMTSMSLAIEEELIAYNKTRLKNIDWDKIAQLCKDAQGDLDKAIERVKEAQAADKIDKAEAGNIIDRLRSARDEDEKCRDAADVHNGAKVRKSIETALKFKREALDRMTKRGLTKKN